MTYRPALLTTVSQQALSAATPQALATITSAAATQAAASATAAQNALAALQAFQTQAATVAPAAPTLTAVAGDGQVTLTITDGAPGSSAITAHMLYKGATAGGLALAGTIQLTQNGTYQDMGLTNGTAEFYAVSAVNTVEGARSAVVSATPMAPAQTGPFPLTFPGAAGTAPTGNSHVIPIQGSATSVLDGNGGLVQIAAQTYNIFDAIGAQGDGLYTVSVQPGSYRFGQFFFHTSADQNSRYWLTFNADSSGIGFEQVVNGAYSNKGRFLYYQTDPTSQAVTAAGGSFGVVINGNTVTPLVDGALPSISGGSQSYTTDGGITGPGLIGVGIYDSGGKSVVYTRVDFTPLNQVPVAFGGTSTTATTVPGRPGSYGSTGTGGTTGSSGGATTAQRPSTDNLPDGIYFPANVYLNPNHNGYPYVGTGLVRGMSGPYTVSCSGLPAGVYVQEDGFSGIALQSSDGSPVGTYACTWTVSDGVKTLTKTFNVVVNAANAIELCGNYALDTTNYSYTSGAYRVAPFQLENAASDITITDPAGLFAEELFGGYLDVKIQSQVQSNFGEHDCTMSFKSNDGSTYTQNTQIFLVHEFNPLAKVAHGTLYDSMPVGSVFATVAVRAESGVASVAVSGASDNFSVSLNNSSTLATLKLTAPLVAGSQKPLTVTVTSKSGLTTVLQAPYDVLVGTVLDASHMSFPFATNLDNYAQNQVIGTPTVTGMSGPITWSFQNKDSVKVIYGGANSLFTMADPTTGKLVASGMLSARPEGHLITLTATNGPVSCVASFTVPVAWYANSTVYHVGRGMASAHPGTGFEHISDITPHLGAAYGACEPAFAGSTIIIHPDSDPNYYANDYGGYEMRGGISGPLRITSPDPNGPLVRVGGTVGAANGGFNPAGDKAFFLFNNGDIYLNGFEVSWVNGNGSPDTDYSHGRSAIRKQADAYGDIEVTNCWVHDTNNGMLTGEGPMKINIHHNRFSNCGGQTDSGGQTHGCYLDGSHVIYDHNTSDNNMVGHCLKVRAPIAEITNNVLMDGENGSASNQVNLPQGGKHLLQGNLIHKGPNPQNPYLVSTGEDTINPGSRDDRVLQLTLIGNTFVVGGVSGLDSGAPFAVQHFQSISGLDGSFSQITADSNSFALYGGAGKIHTQNFTPANQNTWTETNSTALVDPPALVPTWFGTASPGPTAPTGFFNFPFYYGNQGFDNYYGVQIKADAEDIRTPVSAVAGTVLTTLRPSGSNFYASDNVANDIRLNPFVANTTWAIVQDQEFFPGTNWAPVGRYAVVPSSDGTMATLTVGSAGLARGYDVIKVRATAPNGTKADKRFYVVGLAA